MHALAPAQFADLESNTPPPAPPWVFFLLLQCYKPAPSSGLYTYCSLYLEHSSLSPGMIGSSSMLTGVSAQMLPAQRDLSGAPWLVGPHLCPCFSLLLIWVPPPNFATFYVFFIRLSPPGGQAVIAEQCLALRRLNSHLQNRDRAGSYVD